MFRVNDFFKTFLVLLLSGFKRFENNFETINKRQEYFQQTYRFFFKHNGALKDLKRLVDN